MPRGSNSSTMTSQGTQSNQSTTSPSSHSTTTPLDTSEPTPAPVARLDVELMWDSLTYPCSLRDGGDSVLTCDRRQFLGQPSRVLALPKAGGTISTLAELSRADAVAVNDWLWVLDSSNDLITRFSLDDGTVGQTLQAPFHTSGLFGSEQGLFATSSQGITWFPPNAASGNSLWMSGETEEVWLMAADEARVYFTVNPPYPAAPGSRYKVMSVDLDFASGRALGQALELANGVGSAKGIAVTPRAVVFADNHNHRVYSVPLGGGDTVLLGDVPDPWSIGVNDTHAYIASRPEQCTSEGGVYRIPLSGGDVEAISTNQVCPSNVLVTPSEVYWLNAGPEQPHGDPSMISGSYSTIMRVAL